MAAEYQIVTGVNKRQLSEFLIREGQFLLPMVKLIEQSELAIDQMIDVLGRASIEAVLELSAQETAGAKSPGKASGDVRWHGRQDGIVHLAERKVNVSKPRLRHKTAGEVNIPAYEALRTEGKLARRMMDILLYGVSTRRYEKVLPEMADSLGISKSSVSRANIEAGGKLLAELAGRRRRGRRGKQACPGAARGLQRERDHRGRVAQGPGGQGGQAAAEPPPAVRDRRGQGAAQRDQRGVWVGEPGAALSCSQASQRLWPLGGRPARQRQEHPAGGVEARGRRRGDQAGRATGQVVRAEVPVGRREPARGAGGDVHPQSTGPSAQALALPGDDQPDRLHALGRASADAARDPLAGRRDGAALGLGGVRGDGGELQEDHGIPAALDAQACPRRVAGGGRSWSQEEGRVTCDDPRAATEPSTTDGTSSRSQPTVLRTFTSASQAPQPPALT